MSCNDNQNHLVQPGRTTSRVLAPSGGQSSLTFGILPKKINETSPAPTTATAAAPSKPLNANKVTETIQPASNPSPFTSAILPSQRDETPISSNAFVTGSNMNGGCVMTGRPSSRVLAPPGGHTSFTLG